MRPADAENRRTTRSTVHREQSALHLQASTDPEVARCHQRRPPRFVRQLPARQVYPKERPPRGRSELYPDKGGVVTVPLLASYSEKLRIDVAEGIPTLS